MKKNSVAYGDIFKVGNHIVACGDSRDISFVAEVIGKRKVTMILCDVPYGVSYTELKAGFSKIKTNKKILNDDISSESGYAQFTKDWLAAVVPHLARKNAVYIFNSDKMLFALREGMERSGVKFSQLIIWIKNHLVIGRKDYLPAHELIAYGWAGVHEFKKAKDRSVLFYPKPSSSPLHPTQKPIGLLRRLILNSTSINDIVYDGFAGSGSTGVAAEQTQRSTILIERDEDYVQTILTRMEKSFGLKPERVTKHEQAKK
jgi:DNA modification methylase